MLVKRYQEADHDEQGAQKYPSGTLLHDLTVRTSNYIDREAALWVFVRIEKHYNGNNKQIRMALHTF